MNQMLVSVRGVSIFLLTAIMLLLNMNSAVAQEKSLYERLGGVKPISLVVDDFIDRLVGDEMLNQNPMIVAGRENSPDPYLKFRVTNMVCQATGGPCEYTGMGMKQSHKHLNITEAEWQRMRELFKETLDKFQVPEQEQQELFDIVESTKADIVTVK